MLDEKKARELLKALNAPQEILQHVEAVRETCFDFVDKLREANPNLKINKSLVVVGALLHDIGRTRTQGIDHGVEGGKIIRELYPGDSETEKIARICERHLGGGIPKEEAVKLGLPEADYTPKTLEEKIICYCDKMIDDVDSKTTVHDPDWAAVHYELKHGKNSGPAKRVRELNKFFEDLLKG